MFHKHDRRWSNNQKSFYPFTLAKSKKEHGCYFGAFLHSGDYEENKGCNLKIHFLNYTLITELPQIIKPFAIKHTPKSWDEETIKRLGRNYYYETFDRSYGFKFLFGDTGSTDLGMLFVEYGPQTHDSETTKSWLWFMPFLQWRFHGTTLYDADKQHFYTCLVDNSTHIFDAYYLKEKECTDIKFKFLDYDGEELTARSIIKERTWKFGAGMFRWLSWFKKDMVLHTLDLEFSGETGKRKGTYKGGTMGVGFNMQPNESHEDAFKRYCVEHDMTYIGVI